MIIDHTIGNYENPLHPFIMVCYSANHENQALVELAGDLVTRVDAELNGVFRKDVDFWRFIDISSDDILPENLQDRRERAVLGLCLLSTMFLASAACRQELDYFTAQKRAVLVRLAPMPLLHPRANIPALRGKVVLPWNGSSYADCKIEAEKTRFASIIVSDIMVHLDEVLGN